MTDKITVEILSGTHLRTIAHINGGSEWFGYRLRCIEYPRLQRLDRYMRKDRSVVSTWAVDGEGVENLAMAAEALNHPPVFTEDEIAALALVPDEFANLRHVQDLIAGHEREPGTATASPEHGRAFGLLYALQDKGAVELGKSPDRTDGKPWDDSVPEHMRFSPTIRKAKLA